MNFSSLEFYLNKVQPIREFTQQSNLLHNVLRGKDDYNNLVEAEHNFYKSLKNKYSSSLSKLNKQDTRALKLEIPSKPLLN